MERLTKSKILCLDGNNDHAIASISYFRTDTLDTERRDTGGEYICKLLLSTAKRHINTKKL